MIRRVLLVLAGALFALVFYLFFGGRLGSLIQNSPSEPITSFEECVAAGNPVQESYPPVCRTKDGQTFTQDVGNELELADEIMVTNPRPNQRLESPVNLEGSARGTWFFEGQMSAQLKDAQGTVLTTTAVYAEGEWMSSDFVPFSAEMTFPDPNTDTGTLIIEKANPSGLPENAEELIIPVRF